MNGYYLSREAIKQTKHVANPAQFEHILDAAGFERVEYRPGLGLIYICQRRPADHPDSGIVWGKDCVGLG